MNKSKNWGCLFIIALLMLSITTITYAANIFTETFNGLLNNTNISTSNTNFDYVRIGNGGGSITAQVVNNVTYMRLGGSESGSLNGVGVQSSLGEADVTTLNFRMMLEETNGDIFFGLGKGSTFTGNSIFNTNDLMWGMQSDNGNLRYRTTSWNNTGQTLIPLTNYEFHIVANRSGSTVNYGSYSVANGCMDLFINGMLVGDDLLITNNQNASGFRIYQTGSTGNPSYARFDSITIDNSAVEPFVPTAVSLQSFSAQPNIFLPLLLAAIVALLLSSALIIWQRKRR